LTEDNKLLIDATVNQLMETVVAVAAAAQKVLVVLTTAN